jgi:predicted RNA binding protein YcfA (HicA-like mRNA interferase family)
MKARDAVRDLLNAGFVARGGKGSHTIYYHPQFPHIAVIIAVHGRNSDLPKYAIAQVRKAIVDVETARQTMRG